LRGRLAEAAWIMAQSATPRDREYYRYLAVNPGDRAWGLSVTGAGYQPARPGSDALPTRLHPPGHFYVWDAGRLLSEYAVVYVTHGGGEFDSHGTGPIQLGAGDALVLFPGVWHRYRASKKTGWGIHWVHFQGNTADRLRADGILKPDQAVLRIGLDPLILQAFKDVLDALRAEPAGFVQIAAAKTLEIVARFAGAASAERSVPRLQEVVSRARLRLEEDPGGLPVVNELIEEFDVSRTHFFRIFKEQTGQSPYKYHLQLKIRRAGEMLRDSNLTVKQISIALGFRNPYHFSKLFRSKTGASPRTYRDHWRTISIGARETNG
ncbi:MAG: AraC family transcriptional regulator, partial [Pirellulales bacterium]